MVLLYTFIQIPNIAYKITDTAVKIKINNCSMTLYLKGTKNNNSKLPRSNSSESIVENTNQDDMIKNA